ncbi:DUF58 domain-containing protein [Fimbriiglobus ruber]|uniref:DUF58 domain-containing protein n=1 Tax=Fimbriiglobus ruber TaxID=1908690 RepID=A0A225DLF9_9BACT|nr:DUF58 domain-containing protein [Fimbriiglobus ruber]OWK42241.1 hypothetical protein FRUB_04319 [Fimbriiglobus ruber]
MTPVPSVRLLTVVASIGGASLALLVFPGAWPVLVTIDVLVLLAAVIDLVVSPRPSALRAVRLAPDRMSVGSQHRVAIRVENRSGVPVWVRVRDGTPEAFEGADAELTGPAPALGEVRWEYAVLSRSRGRFPWGPIFLRYRTVLGLWERTREEPAAGESRVYPNLALLERYHLLARADRLAALGIRRVRLRGGATEFESLREYSPGDDGRQVDWKATARRGRLTVRHWEAEKNQTVLLLLDCGRLMNATEDGIAKLDHAITAALILAHVALSRGDRVGLCTFSGKVHAWLTPRGNPAQNRLIAETLYDLAGDFAESDHGRCLKLVAAKYPKRSLLVVLTDFVDATTAADMVAHLQLAARRHVVLFAALKDAFLERAARAAPATERDGFRKAAAVDLLRERAEVLEQIRHAGGFVIDAEPGAITPPVINGYLEVVLGGLL